MTRCLPLFHDIRGSFDRDPGAPFDLVELFELKHFLVTLEQVVQAYAKMPPMSGIAFPSEDDIATTESLAPFLARMGVELVDHLIFVDDDMVSLRDSGFYRP